MSFTLPSSPKLGRDSTNGVHLDDGNGTPRSNGRSIRHARKLQLRSAGFRGPTVPTRIVTPKSPSESTCWSASGNGEGGLSGAENVPPGTRDARTPSHGNRLSSVGVLQDIGNATVTRRKKARPRMSEPGVMSDEDGVGEGEMYSGFATVTPVFAAKQRGGRSGTAKAKARLTQRRRSASAETSRYIEHLETELAAAQAQVSRLNSPTTTRKQTTHLRSIDAEREMLQREIDDWEAKYEQRIQEEVDRHHEIETSLRNRIRVLEQDSEESHFRIQELQVKIESTTQSMNAVEAANVNLERRIEIMSELLAASPSKIDLHAETPGRGRKHVRPKSMLPRFPTASSLLGSPERQPQTQPTSPLMSFANYSPHIPSSPAQSVCRLDIASQHSDYMSEAESVFSEAASATGDSMTSAENFDASTSFNPWTLPPPPPPSRLKPARRMRRFGAGSLGPKPLILPSTAHCDTLPPVSAPALERSETVPAMFAERSASSDRSDRPLLGRRRASTMANGEGLAAHAHPPSFFAEEFSVQEDETLMHLASSSSPASRPVTRDLSSLGSVRGRNLMDELTAVCMTESGVSSDYAYERLDESGLDAAECNIRILGSISDGTTLVQEHANVRQTSIAEGLVIESSLPGSLVPAQRDSCRRASSYQLCCSPSLVQRLRFLFGDFWHSPVEIARHLIQTAQMRMRIPRPLLNAQWWLIGVLLGPMAPRRMLNAPRQNYASSQSFDEETLLLNTSPSGHVEADPLAYGTLYDTPSSPLTRSSKAAHKSPAKRPVHRPNCPHRRAKHSPLVWLRFSLALAFAVGTAFKDGPASLLQTTVCECQLMDYVSRLSNADRERRGV